MNEKNTKPFRKAFGTDEIGEICCPPKIGNVKLARLKHEKRECSFCFPHGWETSNATIRKNRRSWKHTRKTQYWQRR